MASRAVVTPPGLTPPVMLAAYASGVFPMAASADDPELHWFDPPHRGVLPVGGVHLSRSLARDLRRGDWTASITHDFEDIVAHCAARDETWINPPLARLYRDLHELGHAEALAVYAGGELAGGIFGVTLKGAFFGESMFSTQTSGSRAALVWISAHLAACGFTLFDTQYLTPHLASMGGREIPRRIYRQRLAAALQDDADFRRYPLPPVSSLLSGAG